VAKVRKPIGIEDIVADSDDDDSAVAARLHKAAKAAPKKRRSEVPFMKLRAHWLPMLYRARAESAMGLLAVIALQMDMGDVARTAITEKTWAKVGNRTGGKRGTEERRRRMLRALGRVPDVVRLEFRLRTGSKYAAHKGKWFDRAPPRLVFDIDAEET
jgi:hypothetical protein